MPILIVESNSKDAQYLAGVIREAGRIPLTTDSPRSGLAILRKESLELVLLSVNGHKQRAVEFLEATQNQGAAPPVIVMTDKADLEDATRLMKLGAHDYWVKPIAAERLSKTVELLAIKAHKPDPSDTLPQARAIITQNHQMLQLKALAEKVAATSATVFIQGESGTGKELFARFIHQRSERRTQPFIAVNCAALPEGLLESELFGYEKGAFTGAIRSKEGKFEMANGGTLLLDEVTEMPVHLQAKLLRALQESEIDRVGGRHPIVVDVRVIATTNTDVIRAIAEGNFRKDLYYRLNVIPIKIPPLRDRPGDVLLLAQHFIDKYNQIHGRTIGRTASDALNRLQSYSWPGNVRELENVIQRAVLIAVGSELSSEYLLFDQDSTQPQTAMALMPLEEMERLMIGKALDSVQGNRTRAAEILGISVRTLRNKLQEYRQNQPI
ncbi:MAG TPA: sigma-54-dependent Fis family transcriptional regulator [Syntrophobacteraceae bacterium]|nr:sigma-54-dependent Fis family transcriptional regulator [Syntrophobacteraceae bacterium]